MTDTTYENRRLLKQVDEQYKEGIVYSFFSDITGFLALFVLVVAIVLEMYFSTINRNWAMYIVEPLFIFLTPFCAFILFRGRANKEKSIAKLNYYIIASGCEYMGFFRRVEVWVSFLFHRKLSVEDPLLEAVVLMKAKNPTVNLVDVYDKEPSFFSEEALGVFRK